jgi:hypothetical protein
MHKRIEIIVRNPGLEGTEQAIGSLAIDFETEAAFKKSSDQLTELLSRPWPSLKSIILSNDHGEDLGFNPEYYVSHRASNVDEWIPTWVLPAEGAPAPPRES